MKPCKHYHKSTPQYEGVEKQIGHKGEQRKVHDTRTVAARDGKKAQINFNSMQ